MCPGEAQRNALGLCRKCLRAHALGLLLLLFVPYWGAYLGLSRYAMARSSQREKFDWQSSGHMFFLPGAPEVDLDRIEKCRCRRNHRLLLVAFFPLRVFEWKFLGGYRPVTRMPHGIGG